MEPGEKLAMARRYHRPALTQKDLAEMVGADVSSVGRWESTNVIPPRRIARLSEIFGVHPSWWTDGASAPPPAAGSGEVPVEQSNVQVVHPSQYSKADRTLVSGDSAMIPVWRGVVAGFEDECYFPDDDPPQLNAVPGWLLGGNHPDETVLCIASGQSMMPRIGHKDKVIVRLDPDVPPGCLVVARNTEGRNYIKRLVRADRRLELQSINPEYPPIENLDGWTLKGGVIAILQPYGEPGRNIEFDDGRYLRA